MRLPFLLVALVVGCGVVEQQTASQQRDPLVGGNVDDGGFRDVVMLRAVFTNDAGVTQGFACTGTVITPTVVLTAAHCLNENGGPSGYALTGVFFHNFDVAPPTNSASWVPATSWRRHPSWSAGSAMNTDIGLVRLPAPIPGVTPSPYLNRPLVAADVGQPMKVVGYGITSSGGTGAGTRRFVTLPLRGLTTQHVQLGNMSTAGICNGDSGGPSFLTARDGVRRVAGVHSWTQPAGNCMDGLDTRVDLYGPFIRQFITDNSGATCVEDGLCASGCASPDPDCVCGADGTCNAQCPNLLTDPDCPAECVADGLCSTLACPRLDPDCTAELSTCTQDTQCQYRTCATDPQRPTRYCSRPCTATCPMGTSCVGSVCLQPQLPTAMEGQACTPNATFCLSNTVCASATGAPLACRRTCMTDVQCATTDECVPGQGAPRVCVRKPPEAMPGEPCMVGVTRCLGGTTCTGLPGGATTCRATCTTDANCAMSDECVDGVNSVRLCVPRPPPVMAGEACTPGVSRCVAPTSCTGLPGRATTCRATCLMDGQCASTEECVPAQGALRVCEAKPPEAMPGGMCTIGLTRCLGATVCTGLQGRATTCRATCLMDSQCAATEECVPAQGNVRVCEPKPPEATLGGACTIGLTRCLGATTCTGLPGAQPTCLETCEIESDCPADSFCGRGQNDAGVCQKQPVFVEPVPTTQPAAPKTGCSATTGLELGLAALLLTMRRSRAR